MTRNRGRSPGIENSGRRIVNRAAESCSHPHASIRDTRGRDNSTEEGWTRCARNNTDATCLMRIKQFGKIRTGELRARAG